MRKSSGDPRADSDSLEDFGERARLQQARCPALDGGFGALLNARHRVARERSETQADQGLQQGCAAFSLSYDPGLFERALEHHGALGEERAGDGVIGLGRKSAASGSGTASA